MGLLNDANGFDGVAPVGAKVFATGVAIEVGSIEVEVVGAVKADEIDVAAGGVGFLKRLEAWVFVLLCNFGGAALWPKVNFGAAEGVVDVCVVPNRLVEV